jgi:hypothetical protein
MILRLCDSVEMLLDPLTSGLFCRSILRDLKPGSLCSICVCAARPMDVQSLIVNG